MIVIKSPLLCGWYTETFRGDWEEQLRGNLAGKALTLFVVGDNIFTLKRPWEIQVNISSR